jgi:hypothetical protein
VSSHLTTVHRSTKVEPRSPFILESPPMRFRSTAHWLPERATACLIATEIGRADFRRPVFLLAPRSGPGMTLKRARSVPRAAKAKSRRSSSSLGVTVGATDGLLSGTCDFLSGL